MDEKTDTTPRSTRQKKSPAAATGKPRAKAAGQPRKSGGRGINAAAAKARPSASRSRPRAMLSKASGIAQAAADDMFHVASDGAATLSRQMAGMLDGRVARGAEVIAQVASSARLAAEDLDDTVPQVAGAVRSVADQIDTYAETIRDQSVEHVFHTASDFTRRQPAVAFGLAALAGFMIFRAFRSAPGYQPRGGRDEL